MGRRQDHAVPCRTLIVLGGTLTSECFGVAVVARCSLECVKMIHTRTSFAPHQVQTVRWQRRPDTPNRFHGRVPQGVIGG